MAAATTAIAAAGAAVGVAGGIKKMIGAGKRKRETKRAIRKFNRERQKITNAQEGRTISTRGARVALDEQARLAATSLDTLASGGIRGVVGGVGAVGNQNRNVANQVGANLDQQQVALDRDVAIGEETRMRMQEARDSQEQQLLYGELNAAQQDQASGLGDIAGSAFGAANIMGNVDAAEAYGNAGVNQTPYVSKLRQSNQPVKLGGGYGLDSLPPVFTGQ